MKLPDDHQRLLQEEEQEKEEIRAIRATWEEVQRLNPLESFHSEEDRSVRKMLARVDYLRRKWPEEFKKRSDRERRASSAAAAESDTTGAERERPPLSGPALAGAPAVGDAVKGPVQRGGRPRDYSDEFCCKAAEKKKQGKSWAVIARDKDIRRLAGKKGKELNGPMVRGAVRRIEQNKRKAAPA